MIGETDFEQARTALFDAGASLLQVQKAVTLLETAAPDLADRRLGLASNVQVDRLGLYLRRHALRAKVRLAVEVGAYDSLLPNMDRFTQSEVDVALLIPFFDNLMPAFEAQLEAGLEDGAVDERVASFSEQLRLALAAGRTIPQVLVCNVHRAWPAAQLRQTDRIQATLQRFQTAVCETVRLFSNAAVIDLVPAVQTVGLRAAIDRRFYAQAKAPYAIPMLDEIAGRIAAATRGYGRRFHKVLALDCDNTLWGGVIGEDLIGGIKLSPYDYPGSVYWRAQQELLALEKHGVILCLCTKNNLRDVEEVLRDHSDMPIRSKNLTLQKVNWNDKASNLRSIAEELNLSLDSIVFLDDSPYELQGVRTQLPEVTVFQVPTSLTDYPSVIEQIKILFLAGGVSADSVDKTQQYKQKIAAEGSRAQFASQDEYLASLQLKVTVTRNSERDQPRISELSAKSNQFNLTTRRYTIGEVDSAMKSGERAVYSFVVEDKFGSAGLTGAAVIAYDGVVAKVEAFLMSCRVIGRGVEFAVWSVIVRDAATRGCRTLMGRYQATAKNALVERFFDQLGLAVVEEGEDGRIYETSLNRVNSQKSPWVEVVSVG